MARAAFRDVSSLLSGSVIAKPFGVASTMLFARILSKDEMAIFPVAKDAIDNCPEQAISETD